MQFRPFGTYVAAGGMCVTLGLALLGITVELQAEPFVYTGRDLLLGFRQPDSVSEMLVNIGQASNYFNATPGSKLSIPQFTPGQLNTAFSTLDGVLWSVCGTTRSGDGGDPLIPNATLWMTRARGTAEVQTKPWVRKSAFSQGGAANKVNELGINSTLLSDATAADPIRNTATTLIEPSGEPRSFGVVIGDQGNLKGNFQGNIEHSLGIGFSTPSRSDLYEMRPGVGDLAGKYLGYFELLSDGTMSFQAAGGVPPVDPPRPLIESISRNGLMSIITFTTTNDPTVIYSLRFTNSVGLGASVLDWPASGTTVTGNGQSRTLELESDDADRFYSITVSR